jgi:hypothetical protein
MCVRLMSMCKLVSFHGVLMLLAQQSGAHMTWKKHSSGKLLPRGGAVHGRPAMGSAQ